MKKSSQDKVTSQMSNNRCMDADIVVYIHNGILLSSEKRWNPVVFYKVDGARGYWPTIAFHPKQSFTFLRLLDRMRAGEKSFVCLSTLSTQLVQIQLVLNISCGFGRLFFSHHKGKAPGPHVLHPSQLGLYSFPWQHLLQTLFPKVGLQHVILTRRGQTRQNTSEREWQILDDLIMWDREDLLGA